ncbi:MAG: hypothetical protein ACQEQF_13035 [Bacillota bacterium]
MKVVERKDNKVTLCELISNFDNYIVVNIIDGYIYILIKAAGNFIWMDIENDIIWNEFSNLSSAIQAVNIKDMHAFYHYKDFAKWLGKQM